MFINPCFIRKSSCELRTKLDDIGYKLIGATLNEDMCIFTDTEYGVYWIEYFSNIPHEEETDYIDCGTNEDLFLAIAALRDDTDNKQWFVLDTDLSLSHNANGIEYPIGSFIKCGRDKWNIDFNDDGTPCEFSSRNIPAHKATVQELIEHFQNK